MGWLKDKYMIAKTTTSRVTRPVNSVASDVSFISKDMKLRQRGENLMVGVYGKNWKTKRATLF